MNNFVDDSGITTFEKTLLVHVETFKKIQEEENALSMKSQIATTDFQAFLRENGLPDKFTLAEALHLAVRKCK